MSHETPTLTSMNTHSRKTEGATLFVVVLMVLLLLSAVMVVTGQLAMTARRSSTEQEQAVRTQYATESAVARARARLNVLNTVLTTSSSPLAGVKYGVNVASGASAPASLAAAIQNLCGVSSLPAPSPTTVVCSAPAGQTNILAGLSGTTLDNRLTLFNSYVNPKALKVAGASVDPANTADVQRFWRESFGGTKSGAAVNLTVNGATTEATAGAIIKKVMYTELNTYAIYIGIPDINVLATNGNVAQATSLKSNQGNYILIVKPRSFSDYALFTNHHFSSADAEAKGNRIWFTNNTTYTGPVHTNQQLNFDGNDPGPTFRGEVTSAGCQPGTLTGTDGLRDCAAGDKRPGGYFNSATAEFKSADTVGTGTDPVVKTNARCSRYSCTSTNVTPHFGSVDWNSDFKKFPDDAQLQEANAKSGGLFIDGTVSQLALSVETTLTDNNGAALGKTQIIRYTKGATTTTLAINQSGKVYILVSGAYKPAAQVASGEWVDQSTATAPVATTFNGVVYAKAPTDSSGNPIGNGINDLRGPARSPASTTASATNPRPSVASFMKMTIVSNGTMHIKSDLVYQEPPCDLSTGACNNMTAKNILGLYSSGGDIAIDSPKKYTTAASPGVPKNVVINAVTMASKGKVFVDGYDTAYETANELGNVNLVGGMIENYYGAFGLVSGAGFGRNIIFDKRSSYGLVPPSFPTVNEWQSRIQDDKGDTIAIDLATSNQKRISKQTYTDNKSNAQ